MVDINLIGVYSVPGRDDVHLVEMIINAPPDDIDLIKFLQEDPSTSEDNWQVPYDEKYLDVEGERITGDWMDKPSDLTIDVTRLAFFFHYIDFNRPLKTPFGDIHLTSSATMPERLKIIEYVEVD